MKLRVVDPSTSVLIVEDHVVLSETLTVRINREPDIQVVGTTSSPAQLLSIVDTRRPDIVLLDVELGDDNGIALIKQIISRPSSPKVIVLTCRSDTDLVVTAFRQGASAFVPKTAPIKDLLSAIRTVAGGELWLSPALLTRMLPAILTVLDESVTQDPLPLLTDREREVLTFMVQGLSNAAIAKRLHVSIHTIRTHAHNAQTKLQVRSKLAAVAVAHRSGIRVT